MKNIALICSLVAALCGPFVAQAAPGSFEKAKIELRRTVYHDRNDDGDLYCGCTWQWMGRSGGRVDLASCGYEVRADRNRAQRIEWDRMYPVSDWERERDRRIARAMGHANPFVTGERSWSLGYRPLRDGLRGLEEAGGVGVGRGQIAQQAAPAASEGDAGGPVIGNRNSRVYHLPVGCPSYGQVSAKNRVEFAAAAEAEAAGYRRAGNCR